MSSLNRFQTISRILLLALTSFTLVVGFQNCSSKKSSESTSPLEEPKSGPSGTGNGSGYGGKTDGRFYNVASTNVCTQGPLAPSSVIDYVEFTKNGKAYYYDSCEQTNPTEIQLSDLDLTETNQDIIGYQDTGSNYEFSTQVPNQSSNLLPIEGVCYFTGDANPILELQIVVRAPQPPSIEFQTEVYYSYYTNFFQTLNYDKLTPYLSTKSTNISGDLFESSSNNSSLLITSDGGNFLPVRPGTLSIELQGQTRLLQTEVCIFPSDLNI